MNARIILVCFVLFLVISDEAIVEGRSKKVVIHVPLKMKRVKHTHTVYKTIHHHHTHSRDPTLHPSPSEEHEHFHHVHLHEDKPAGQHSQPVPGIGIPEFLPDVPMEVPIEIQQMPSRHFPMPLFRRLNDGGSHTFII